MNNELVEDYYKSMSDFFEGKVRGVTEADRGVLPRLSYSGLEVFKNCPYQFNLKYGEKKYTKETTLALELGSLCHLILELKCNYIKAGKHVDYDYLHFILKYGSIDTNEKTKEHILGVDELKRKYFEEWYESDNASGMTYEEKMEVFKKVLKEEMNHASIWHPIYAELPFEFVYKDRVIFNGFIDRIDINIFGSFRVCDYKTSKKARTFKLGKYKIVVPLAKYKKLINAKNTNKLIGYRLYTGKKITQKVKMGSKWKTKKKVKVYINIDYGGKTGGQCGVPNKYSMFTFTYYQTPGYDGCKPWLTAHKSRALISNL